jgi:hypothetical protein
VSEYRSIENGKVEEKNQRYNIAERSYTVLRDLKYIILKYMA